MIVGFALSYLLLFITFLVAFVACFKAVSDAWLGATPSIGAVAALRAAPRPFAAGVLGIVAGIVVMLGFIACLRPGHLARRSRGACALPALLFERIGPFKALGRSFSLIKGRWWASFLLVVVGYLLVVDHRRRSIQLGLVGIADAVASDNTIVPRDRAGRSARPSAPPITYPYLAAVLTILYFDQRVRKEGFDLQLLAEGFGVERDPDAPLPAPLIGDELYTPEQRAAAPYWPPPPGWTPPPADAEPPQWASSSGWAAPAPDAPPGPLRARRADPLRRSGTRAPTHAPATR